MTKNINMEHFGWVSFPICCEFTSLWRRSAFYLLWKHFSYPLRYKVCYSSWKNKLPSFCLFMLSFFSYFFIFYITKIQKELNLQKFIPLSLCHIIVYKFNCYRKVSSLDLKVIVNCDKTHYSSRICQTTVTKK